MLDSSYAIYENVDFDVKCLVEKTFQSSLISDEQTLALSIGGKKTRSSSADGYFRGVVSNVEILQTAYETIPKELLYFVVIKQILINDDWCKLKRLAQEEFTKPLAPKRKKVT